MKSGEPEGVSVAEHAVDRHKNVDLHVVPVASCGFDNMMRTPMLKECLTVTFRHH